MLAGLARNLPFALALVARLTADELPEHGARNGLKLPGSVAARTGHDRAAGLGAVAVTARAADDRLEFDIPGHAVRRLLERQLDLDRDVGPLGRATARAPNPEPNGSPLPKKAPKMSAMLPNPAKLGSNPPLRRPSWP